MQIPFIQEIVFTDERGLPAHVTYLYTYGDLVCSVQWRADRTLYLMRFGTNEWLHYNAVANRSLLEVQETICADMVDLIQRGLAFYTLRLQQHCTMITESGE